MRRGGRIFVLFGLILALIAGGGVYVLLATATPTAEPVKTTKVVMAVQAITERSEVAPEQLGQADWPVTIPTPQGAYAEPTEVAGQLALRPLSPGQPVTQDMLIGKDENKEQHSYASMIIEKGSVGIAMPVGVSTNVANAIQAGDRVDILATWTVQPVLTNNANAGPPMIHTQRLLADILVLQVGVWPGPEGKAEAGSAVVTFLLKEQDALVLKYSIEQSGGLTLVLRSANDHELWTTEPVTLEYIDKRFGFKFGVVEQAK